MIIKIDILTSEEYERKKDSTYTIRKFLEKRRQEELEVLENRLKELEGIIDLKYDKDGNPIFTPIKSMQYNNSHK